jgi:hypothetical protein
LVTAKDRKSGLLEGKLSRNAIAHQRDVDGGKDATGQSIVTRSVKRNLCSADRQSAKLEGLANLHYF